MTPRRPIIMRTCRFWSPACPAAPPVSVGATAVVLGLEVPDVVVVGLLTDPPGDVTGALLEGLDTGSSEREIGKIDRISDLVEASDKKLSNSDRREESSGGRVEKKTGPGPTGNPEGVGMDCWIVVSDLRVHPFQVWTEWYILINTSEAVRTYCSGQYYESKSGKNPQTEDSSGIHLVRLVHCGDMYDLLVRI
ncbi:hypothetical protein EJ05DRAFT_290083 [Pseudovirgaria hyperparasitica]|uniref:Uncharacterized protein n=1 Tax=Pseudovirgaria hyperparasitica TaxID=470096 RepID=A0A6A6WG40_9PEZI|nr:uncharacterized protein EJ05DRAFT_290083 [Pseudovirgaria hyperparasitica]KAF2760587.1 hypothetical protein EJ05DRAFT_290083 [Pseudovirgaria hyperparasitica]